MTEKVGLSWCIRVPGTQMDGPKKTPYALTRKGSYGKFTNQNAGLGQARSLFYCIIFHTIVMIIVAVIMIIDDYYDTMIIHTYLSLKSE